MKKRIGSFLVALLMVFSVISTAVAIDLRASHYLDSYYVSLTAEGNGEMAISVVVNGVGKQDKIGIQEIIIEREVNGKWYYDRTLDSIEHPEFFEYNSYEYVNEIYFTGTPGVTYRVDVTVYAKKGTGWDTGYVTSYGETCK